jgi:hypothetical protein
VADDSNSLSISKLKEGMNGYLEEVRGGKVRGGGRESSRNCRNRKVLHDGLLPTKFVANSNAMSDGDETTARREWYDRNFPNGTYSFTIPVDDCNSRPDPNYSAAAGVRIWFVHWQLQLRDLRLRCKCGKGHLIHDRYTLLKRTTSASASSGRGGNGAIPIR